MERKINVEGLTEEQMEQAINRVGQLIRDDVDATCERANRLLSRYGMACKMQIVIDEADKLNELHDKIKSEQI